MKLILEHMKPSISINLPFLVCFYLPPSEFQSKRDAAKLVRKILAPHAIQTTNQVSAGVIHDERGFLAMKRSENQPSRENGNFLEEQSSWMNHQKMHF